MTQRRQGTRRGYRTKPQMERTRQEKPRALAPSPEPACVPLLPNCPGMPSPSSGAASSWALGPGGARLLWEAEQSLGEQREAKSRRCLGLLWEGGGLSPSSVCISWWGYFSSGATPNLSLYACLSPSVPVLLFFSVSFYHFMGLQLPAVGNEGPAH